MRGVDLPLFRRISDNCQTHAPFLNFRYQPDDAFFIIQLLACLNLRLSDLIYFHIFFPGLFVFYIDLNVANPSAENLSTLNLSFNLNFVFLEF
jgi:hypothetical protein